MNEMLLLVLLLLLVVTDVCMTLQLVRNLTSASYAESIRRQINDSHTRPFRFYQPAFDDHGTSHIGVLHADGSAVAMTSTINYWYELNSLNSVLTFESNFCVPYITSCNVQSGLGGSTTNFTLHLSFSPFSKVVDEFS